MAITPNNDERSFGADRERQREVSTESRRSAAAAGSETSALGEKSTPSRSRSNRGFASMDSSKQREIASKGGRAAHRKGTAHEFDSGEARAAGRKGGVAVSSNREHMAAIGRRGGEARGANRAARLKAQATEQATAAAARTTAAPATAAPAARFQGDREVGLEGRPTANEQQSRPTNAPRPSGNSLGGESRTASGNDAASIERP